MFSGTRFLALLLVTSYTIAEEFPPNYVESGKISSEGFQAIQGGKSLTSSENEQLDKRAPKGFQGMRGKKNLREENDENLVINDEFEKRVPLSFHGTRGKKDSLTPDFADSYFVDEYYKRAPMGFQGMRGKKTFADDDYYKRAAMGFQGMRGKKSLDLILDQIDNARYGDGSGRNAYMFEYPEEYEKRAPAMGFQGMRGKRGEFEDIWEKRAPMGFQGMRGKKSLFEEIDDLDKRAMMGFQGMRGKKSLPFSYYNDYIPEQGYPDTSRYSNNKETESKIKRFNVGFVGSRGKRGDLEMSIGYPKMIYDSQDVLADEMTGDLFLRPSLDERMDIVPLQFYKRSAYGSTGTRGKKVPRWDIKGKFVGVRGKRSSKMNYDDNGDSLNNVHSNNERIVVDAGTAKKLENQ